MANTTTANYLAPIAALAVAVNSLVHTKNLIPAQAGPVSGSPFQITLLLQKLTTAMAWSGPR